MTDIPYQSNHSFMPAWLTINETANIINQQSGAHVTESDVWRYALYGHITLSIYFQSPVKLLRVKMNKDNIVLIKTRSDIISRLCHLSPECLLSYDHWMVKTEGNYISPASHIIDTPLLGHECIALQKQLARSLNLPPPETGRCNIYCGVLVRYRDELFQLTDNCSPEQRINQQLKYLPSEQATFYFNKVNKRQINRHHPGHFPVYQLPTDAWFVVKRANLENFIRKFFASTDIQEKATRLSTPVSRLLWLACTHNDQISQLVGQPYKLLSVFEQWALTDGITDRLSGNTLKTALERGSPSGS